MRFSWHCSKLALRRAPAVVAAMVAAVGKELSPGDFQEYMDFHNRKLFRREFRPKGFCYAVRPGPERDAAGFVSIEAAPAADAVSDGDSAAWVDHDGEAEIDREELLRFCIKRKYGVDVRPTDQESAESGLTGMVSTAFGAAGLGSFSPFKRSMHNLRTVVPEDGDGNALGAAGAAAKTRLPPVRVATMDRNALEQVLKLKACDCSLEFAPHCSQGLAPFSDREVRQ